LHVFDTVILLTGAVEQPVLAAVLRNHNPALTVLPAVTAADLDAFEPSLLRRARLVAFTTPVIVPARMLDALGYGAYNFHPGSPEYPGWAPAHFAIYDRAPLFGATAHVMIERVDAGPIVGVELLPVPAGATVHSLECLAYAALARLYWLLAKDLATQSDPLPDLGMCWGPRKGSRRSYARMCDIPPDISRDELDRRVRAFGDDHFGLNPSISLHGYTFRLVKSGEDRGTMRQDQTDVALATPLHAETILDAVA
jgi:methionyl-tRNA formyltransferase